MSDPLLPRPEADPTGREEERDVEDVPQPDVLRGADDAPAEDGDPAEDEETSYEPPRAHDGLDDAELREDLADQ